MNVEQTNNNSESLKHFDLSFINQPNITNTKKKNKLERLKEIYQLVTELTEESNTVRKCN